MLREQKSRNEVYSFDFHKLEGRVSKTVFGETNIKY